MAAFFANAFEAIGGFFTQIFMALIDIRFGCDRYTHHCVYHI